MQVVDGPFEGLKFVRPRQLRDDRGWFAEVFHAKELADAGLPTQFVQENESFSRRGVLRGLHYQVGEPQGKLVRVLSGRIWDVTVDLRPGSPNFGKWAGLELTGEVVEYLWIPEGFAHGFVVLSETANLLYKTTAYYHPIGERCIRWDDPTLNIAWPLEGIGEPLISAKDADGRWISEAELPPAYLTSASERRPTTLEWAGWLPMNSIS